MAGETTDGEYVYTEGTINEKVLDNVTVYEENGNVVFSDGENEVRLHELGVALSGERDDPTADELAEGETLIYRSGDALVAAYHDPEDNTIKVNDAVADLTADV